MNSNKKKAGLLWGILPLSIKKNLIPYFTIEEIIELNQQLKHYKELSITEKQYISRELYYIFSNKNYILNLALFIFLIIFLFLFILYIVTYPEVNPIFLFSLFWPFGLGIFSFLLLLTLRNYQLFLLFRFSKNFQDYILSLVIYYIILYLLYSINKIDKFSTYTNILYLMEKIILCFGITLAPITEEFIFRYQIPEFFKKSIWNHYIGHLISNLIFAFLHIPSSSEQFFLYFLSGMFLSVLRLITDKLLFCIVVHSLSNLTIFFILN